VNVQKPQTQLSPRSFTASNNSVQKSTQTLQLSNTTASNSNSNTNATNDQGEIAKSTAAEARPFSTSRPGQPLDQRIFGANIPKPSSSGLSNVSALRNNANDIAGFQAMIKGTQETAKTIADGIARAFGAFGAVAQTAFMAAKKDGGQGGGGGQESSSSGRQQQTSSQQQSPQQQNTQQQMFAQDPQANGGGGKAA
jgi:hypothetical protein